MIIIPRIVSVFLTFTLILLTVSSLSTARAAEESRRNEAKVPQNSLFTLELLSPISTAVNKKGDAFRCQVVAPDQYRGAIVDGELTKVEASGKVKGKSKIAMGFRLITLPNGDAGKFDGQIKEVYELEGAANQGRAGNEGEVKAKSYRKRDALRITVAAGIGALLGGALGGREGALLGATIAGSLAAAGTLSEKGPNLEFGDGTRFVVLTAGR